MGTAHDIPDIENLITFADCAKIYNWHGADGKPIGRNQLFEILRAQGILLPSSSYYNRPNQKYVDAGYFALRLKKLGNGELKAVPFFTEKGLEWIGRVMEKLGYVATPVASTPIEQPERELFE